MVTYEAWTPLQGAVSDTSWTLTLVGHALDTCRTPLHGVTIKNKFFFPAQTRGGHGLDTLSRHFLAGHLLDTPIIKKSMF